MCHVTCTSIFCSVCVSPPPSILSPPVPSFSAVPVIVRVCQIYFSCFFPSLFSLKSPTGCVLPTDVKAAAHHPHWFFLFRQKMKTMSTSDSYSDLALQDRNSQLDIPHISLMPFYIIYLAWFFTKRNGRGRPAAEVLCFYIFQTTHSY